MRIGQTLYFDYQATTPVDEIVLDEMMPYFHTKFGNPNSNDHFIGWEANKGFERAKSSLASFIGADSEQIIFTSGASEANNFIISSMGKAADIDSVLYCSTDHKSVIEPIRAFCGDKQIVKVPVDKSGVVDLDFVEKHVQNNKCFVAICAVNNEVGTIQPFEEIAEIVHEADGFVHFDASQAPCVYDMKPIVELADFVSFSAHKMYGPKGIGCLFYQTELRRLLRPIIIGGGQQDNLRSGTVPVPLCVGFAKAAEIMGKSTDEHERIRELRNKLWMGLKSQYDFVGLNGPALNDRHPGNLNVCFEGFDARELICVMQPLLAASMGSACNSGISEPSYVLRELGLTYQQAQSSIRFSMGRFTTSDQIDEALEIIDEALDSASKLGAHGIFPQKEYCDI